MSWPLPEMVACMPWVGKPWLTGERIKPSESGSVWGTSAVSANELLGSGIQASVTVKRRDSFQEVKGGDKPGLARIGQAGSKRRASVTICRNSPTTAWVTASV